MNKSIKVYLVCTGVGIINRGIETFARECFDGLHGIEGLQIELFKGAGEENSDEHRLWNLPRNGKLAPFLGKIINRNGYAIEQLSSFLPFVDRIRKGKPDIIFYSDSNLGFQLYKWRKQIGVPYRLLFSNGGPCEPPFSRTDFVQQVAPFYKEQALLAGEVSSKHFQVPYGINVPDRNILLKDGDRRKLKQQLGLPIDRQIVISVGWISATHKRMDYVVEEIAALPEPRPYLVMLGHIDSNSPPIIELATQKLGQDGFMARSLPYEQVSNYYSVADIFVLGSLKEGFGRVYLEAMIHGLPCIVNDHPVMRYVLAEQGIFVDLSKPDAMSTALADLLQRSQNLDSKIGRIEYVRGKFSWENLAQDYLQMFINCTT